MPLHRETDYRVIKRLTNQNPVISSEYIYLSDDNYIWYLTSYKDGLEIHRCDKTPCKGKEGLRSGREVFNWVFSNTEYTTIYAVMREDNKPARYIACHAGMKRLYKEGEYIIYGITNTQTTK